MCCDDRRSSWCLRREGVMGDATLAKRRSSGGWLSTLGHAQRYLWPPRFSLRTLLLVTVCYTCLWALTSFVADDAHRTILDQDLRGLGVLNVPVVFVSQDPGPESRIVTQEEWTRIGAGRLRRLFYVHQETTAFAPFVYRADFSVGTVSDQGNSTFMLNSWGEMRGRHRVWCVWFFGINWRFWEVCSGQANQ